MLTDVKSETFRDLVQNSRILEFARPLITRSYMECTPGREAETRRLLDEAFTSLAEAAGDPAHFPAAIEGLRTQVFRKTNPDFWFNQVYKEYKRGFKPRRRVQNLQPWLKGETVLDLGCGDGLTSLVLQQTGYAPWLTDVIDYRDPAARGLPFAPMPHPGSLPYAGQRFDSAIVLAVLHHVEAQSLEPLLRDLRSRAGRVIVEEDTYDLPSALESLPAVLQRDTDLRAFIGLSPQDQLRYLMFIDYFANALTQGIVEMDIPFNFHPVREWQRIFETQGFQVSAIQVMGFQPDFFNRSCHVWFILD